MQGVESKKAERGTVLGQLTEEISKKKLDIDELNRKEKEMAEEIAKKRGEIEESRHEISELQDKRDSNDMKLDVMKKEEDKLKSEIAAGIDDLRSGKKGGQERPAREFKPVSSEMMITTRDTLKKRELLRSRAPKGKIYDPEMSTEYHCKCQLF